MSIALSRMVMAGSLALACLVPTGSAWANSSGKWTSGKEVYDKVCAYCHEKGVGPAIKGRGAPLAYRVIVRQGRGAMPPFRATEISDEALAMVMEHIK